MTIPALVWGKRAGVEMSFMSVDGFIDTNLLVYAAAGRDGEEHKRQTALELLGSCDLGLSAQVLQEFYVVVTRKIEVPLSPPEALEWIEQLEAFPVVPIDTALVKLAAEASERWQLSYWDGAIIAAADILGASVLYTEDLNHAQAYGRVTAHNPFQAA